MLFRVVGLILIAALAASLNAFAKDPPLSSCRHYLNSKFYEQSRVFETTEPIWALKPENGSIESRQPGIVGNLIRIREELVSDKYSAWTNERTLFRLAALKNLSSDPRLMAMVDRVVLYLAHENDVNRVLSKLWELTIACFFDGEEIKIGHTVAELFPKDYERSHRHNFDATAVRKAWERELDVAVHRRNGSWHWIEVKNWRPSAALREDSKKEIRAQNLGQNNSRYMLRNHEIEISLVLKFGLPEEEFLRYKATTDFDNILFAYPARLPGSNPDNR